jgi:hypothetical protein
VPSPLASENFYRTLQRLQIVLVLAGRRSWARMGPDFDPSWALVAPQLVQVTSAAQLAAATAATAYVPAVLDETGQPDAPEARVSPQAFAGVASDGRTLEGLLLGATRFAKQAVGKGAGVDSALALGGRWLDGALSTVVTDAARDVAFTEVALRPRMGWVRMVNPPCCSRCAVLAGKWYSRQDILPRHRRCDCTLIPSQENRAGDFTTSAADLHRRGLITDLSADQRKRIADGADPVKVLNEGRDRWRARLALERARAKDAAKRLQGPQGWGAGTPNPLPPGGIQDFLSHLTSRVHAINELKARGIAA